jgi:hypothetical protein
MSVETSGRHQRVGTSRHRHGLRLAASGPTAIREISSPPGRFEDPGRARWQRPARLIRAIGVRRGDTVAEIAGTDIRAATRPGVGIRGARLRRRRRAACRLLGSSDAQALVTSRLLAGTTTALGRSCDLVLVVNNTTSGGPRYLRRLRRLPGRRPAGERHLTAGRRQSARPPSVASPVRPPPARASGGPPLPGGDVPAVPVPFSSCDPGGLPQPLLARVAPDKRGRANERCGCRPGRAWWRSSHPHLPITPARPARDS